MEEEENKGKERKEREDYEGIGKEEKIDVIVV